MKSKPLIPLDEGPPSIEELRRWASISVPGVYIPTIKAIGTVCLQLYALQKAVEGLGVELQELRKVIGSK
jgi:hypothetical protein